MQATISKRELNKDRTREAVRSEGLRLFREQGFENTTVEQIAQTAGTSLRTFFRYFRCKEALLFDTERLPDVLAGIENPPPGEGLMATLHRVAGRIDRQTDARRRAFRRKLMVRNPSIRLYLYQVMAEAEPLVIATVARRLEVDPDHDPRPLVFAQLLTALAVAVTDQRPTQGTGVADQWLATARDLFHEASGQPDRYALHCD